MKFSFIPMEMRGMGQKTPPFYCLLTKNNILNRSVYLFKLQENKKDAKGLELLKTTIQGQNLVWSFGDLASINFGTFFFVQDKSQYLR